MPLMKFTNSGATFLITKGVVLVPKKLRRGVVTPNPIQVLSAPIENIIRIPAQAGRFALLVDGTEVVEPRVFTADEIAAGFVEFTASNSWEV